MWRGRGGGDTGGQPPSWRNASRPFLPRPSIVWRGRGGGEGVERAPSSHATLRPSRSPPRIIWRGREGGQSPGPRNEPDEITNNEIKTPCIQFLKGTCTYGAACRFSHDINNTVPEPDVRPSFPKEDEETREAYKAWRSLLRKDTQSFYGSGSLNHANKLWKGALRILDSDNQEQHHELARDLVNEEFHGPEWITLTSKISKFSDMTELLCVKKFLQVITHPSIKPLSIDSFVGIMFLLLGGTNGEQGIDLLSNMCLKLGQVIEKSEEPNSNQIQEVVDVVLKTLLELLTKIQRAQLSDHVPQLLKSLDTLVEWIADSASRNQIDSLKARLDIIKRVVAGSLDRVVVAALSSGNKNKNKKTRCTTSTFPREAEIPGGRHDNDFADILDISILPTQGEVISEHAEYLPSTNFLHPHVLEDPMQRYVDSTFRLVRHDTLGLVNDALRDVLAMEDVGAIRVSEKNSQAHVYQSSTILNVWVHEKKGLEFQVSLLPPNFLLKKSFDDQRDWWQRSPRLGEGTLICFVSSRKEGQRLLFLNVTKKSTQEDPVGNPKKGTLVSQLNMSSITAKLATHEQSDLALLLQLWREGTQGVLVDFNGIIPETFMPILKNLQAIKEENHIAFQNWILPSPEENDRMQPPLYARKPGFVFPLGCIAKTGDRNLLLDPSAKLEDIDLDEIENATGLDHGQCLGLVEALTREYALIQGPPGTGKSYLGVQLVRSLLAVKERAKLGPIVIICYTNHALDQFLEHLLGVGIEKIIRIGGRSVSEQLDGKNLRVVSKETPKTRVESQILGKTYKEQDSALKAAENALSPIHESRKGSGWDAIERHLMQEYPEIHQQFRRVDDEGFQTVSKDPFRAWLGPEPPLTGDWERPIMEIISSAELSAYRLTSMERWRFVMYLFDELKERQLEMLHESLEDFETKRETIRKTHEALAQRTLTRADVIGITTTALAGRIEMLRSLRFKVVVCEEAGELKESDLISALKSGVEHFIQIGDHKQLRPQINNFDLSLESSTGQRWQLDRSQFERRAVGEPGLAPAPFAQLNVQRRMRPEISRLIRRVYPDLEDHDSVGDLPDVVGMGKNLFWLDHNHPEDDGGDGTRVKSHSNKWETDMATALVRHLVRQGTYKPEDIALLTPYTGQLQQLRATLRRDFEVCLSDRDMDRLAHEGFDDESTTNETNKPSEGPQKMVEKKQLLQSIRIATVDNFQGEEAKVIIVSLVRSNAKRNVGFLRTENRINVLLSRAKHGMYLIGNSETYLNVAMWTDVYNQLMKAAAVDTKTLPSSVRNPKTLQSRALKVAVSFPVLEDSNHAVIDARRDATRM
ncbi:hypothetical protein NW766_004463 [Fusarium irregulare]|uniref:C3H1-type domain-containing protein n=1 Tax=Fusarium irregulare TaxID=2494466 RepID=A0A9W8UBF2_9HYPO|nr:hypothetical protein NW766_004463 [Fusarium irregulare]